MYKNIEGSPQYVQNSIKLILQGGQGVAMVLERHPDATAD